MYIHWEQRQKKLAVPRHEYRLAAAALMWGRLQAPHVSPDMSPQQAEDQREAMLSRYVLEVAADATDLIEYERSVADELARKTQSIKRTAGSTFEAEPVATDRTSLDYLDYRTFIGLAASNHMRHGNKNSSPRPLPSTQEAEALDCVEAALRSDKWLLEPRATAVALTGLHYIGSTNRLTSTARRLAHTYAPSIAGTYDVMTDQGVPEPHLPRQARKALREIIRTESATYRNSIGT